MLKNTFFYSCQILILAFLFCLQSCSIQEEIRLNPDYSGSMSYVFDMSMMNQSTKELQKQMEKNDSSNTEKKEDDKLTFMDNNPQIDIILNKIKKISGITNVKNESIGREKLAFNFGFKNLKALNEAYGHIHSSKNLIQGLAQKGGDGFQKGSPTEELFSDKNMPEPEYFEYFKQKGRKFYVNFPDNKATKTEVKGDNKQMQDMMTGMFKSETRIVLPKDIKSNSAKNTDASTEGNTLTITQKMTDTNGKGGNVSLKLK